MRRNSTEPLPETGTLPGVQGVASAQTIQRTTEASPEAQATGRRRPRKADIRAVLLEVSDGHSVRAACRKLGLNHSHVIDALNTDVWRDQYTRAREERGLVIGEKVFAVADAALRGKITAENGEVLLVAPDQCRVAMQGYQWGAERMAPKLLGARIKVAEEKTEPWRLFIND